MKSTKKEVLNAAVEHEYNFFFNIIDEKSYSVAPFANFMVLLDLPAEVFSKPSEWMGYPDVCNLASEHEAGQSQEAVVVEREDE